MARAAASPANRRQMYVDDDLVKFLFDEVALLKAELSALYAKLDADAGVGDTDYAADLEALTPASPTLFDG